MNDAIEVILWVLVIFQIVGTLGTVASVGKPREPLSGGVAAFVVAANSIFLYALLVTLLT